jgi:hypothetical protein
MKGKICLVAMLGLTISAYADVEYGNYVVADTFGLSRDHVALRAVGGRPVLKTDFDLISEGCGSSAGEVVARSENVIKFRLNKGRCDHIQGNTVTFEHFRVFLTGEDRYRISILESVANPHDPRKKQVRRIQWSLRKAAR